MDIINKIKYFITGEAKYNESSFKIKMADAFNIVGVADRLKADFLKHTKRVGEITSLNFNDNSTKLLTINGRNYWCVQIIDADILEKDACITDEDSDNGFTTDDMLFLRCLIDVETGEYVYYPYKVKS